MKITHTFYLASSLALTLSCGIPEEPLTVEPVASTRSALNKSGTRIRLRLTTTTHTSSDGASYEIPMYSPQPFDSKLGVNCLALLAEDNVMRCIPSEVPTVADFYADSACRERMAYTFACSAGIQKYAVQPISDTSPACAPVTRSKVFQVRAEITPSRWYMMIGGVCTDIGVPPNTYKYYSLGTAVAASEFVTMRMTTRTDTLP